MSAVSLWCFKTFWRNGFWDDHTYSRLHKNTNSAEKWKKCIIMKIHGVIEFFFTPKKQIGLMSCRKHICSWSEICLSTAASAFSCHLSERLPLSWRSHLLLCQAWFLLLLQMCVPMSFFSWVSSTDSKAILSVPYAPAWFAVSLINAGREMSAVIREGQEEESRGFVFVVCLSHWNVTSMEAEALIFPFSTVSPGSIDNSAWHIESVLLLLLLFLTPCSGIHSALQLYTTVQYTGFSYFYHRVDSEPCGNTHSLWV